LGVAVHIGSQLTSLEPFEAAYTKVAQLVQDLRAANHQIKRVDLGGGLGIRYHSEIIPSVASYGAMVRKITDHLKAKLIFEPGRSLVGAAGILVCRVISVKKTGEKRFVVVDAGMNDFMRTALYDMPHKIITVVDPAKNPNRYACDVVGPVCETTDSFAENILLPEVKAGELLAILDTGAYGSVLANAYNVRLPAPEVLVDGEKFAVIKKRPTYDELLGVYRQPLWATV
jgi:diaminopimelate decarboxylase